MAASVLSRWSTQVNKLTENKKEEKRGVGRISRYQYNEKSGGSSMT